MSAAFPPSRPQDHDVRGSAVPTIAQIDRVCDRHTERGLCPALLDKTRRHVKSAATPLR
jgi:hypothetical protein